MKRLQAFWLGGADKTWDNYTCVISLRTRRGQSLITGDLLISVEVVQQIAGVIALGVIALWFFYVIPQQLRFRQQALQSRVEDRFSAELKVLKVAGQQPAEVPQTEQHLPLLLTRKMVPAQQVQHLTSGGLMNRPAASSAYRPQAPIGARAAAYSAGGTFTPANVEKIRAERSRLLARRRAAARRRAVLASVLLVATVTGAALAGAGVVAGWLLGLAFAPAVLLAGVLILGRRAVIGNRAADARFESRYAGTEVLTQRVGSGAVARVAASASASAPSATTSAAAAPAGAAPAASAVVPAVVETAEGEVVTGDIPLDNSDSSWVLRSDVARAATGGIPLQEIDAELEAQSSAESAVDAMIAEHEASGAQVPVQSGAISMQDLQVPLPTYTLKSSVRRGEPVALGADDVITPATAVLPAEAEGADEDSATAASDPTGAAPLAGGSGLDAILARRRAANE